MRQKRLVPVLAGVVLAIVFIAGCTAGSGNTTIKASGTISTDTIKVAAEINGQIAQIKVNKGDSVKEGNILFVLDDDVVSAQADEADAAVQVAQAAVDSAKQNVADAQAQADLALHNARLQNSAARTRDWTASQPSDFSLPGWYFQKSEQVAALNAVIQSSQDNLDTETANLTKVLADASNEDFVAAEKRLAQAQQNYTVTQNTLDAAKKALDNSKLVDAAQKLADAAKSELDAAQTAYDKMLSSDAASNVLEARARVAVVQEVLADAQQTLTTYQTGDDSLQVTAAQAALAAAQGAQQQAEANLTQTLAAQSLAKIQLGKATVVSPTDGVVLSKSANEGEFTSAGATVLEIGNLDPVTLTVYIPEDEYGHITLGQAASISVDSFPDKSFSGTVTYISDQAEFTPRNVQTTESRSTTVYRVDIQIANPDHELKPGMPADAKLEVTK